MRLLARFLVLVGLTALTEMPLPCPAQSGGGGFTAPAAEIGSPAPMTRASAALYSLRQMGYWTSDEVAVSKKGAPLPTAVDITKTAPNRQAILSFQKLKGLARTGSLDDATFDSIMRSNSPIAHDSSHRWHIEVDLNHQVLFVVDSLDCVRHILPVSTGSGVSFRTNEFGWHYAMTPRGRFSVYYKVSGWKKSPLGMLYYPLYVRGGVAIHGAQQVPANPVSHGCIRIPMFAAKALFAMTPVGTPALVFGENPVPTQSPEDPRRRKH